MCTVVVRWDAGAPVQVLALRDELVGREFDDPGNWWPDQPGVVGGRDRSAGGTWCASDLESGRSALVLNRPERRLAAPGASSRGVLPLLALAHGPSWQTAMKLDGMASFSLLLATPGSLTSWDFDGSTLTRRNHQPGTLMFTSGGAEDGKADRFLSSFESADFPAGWHAILEALSPTDDLASLVVRHQRDGRVYATVFGQLFEQEPGRLHFEYSRTPWGNAPWSVRDLPV